MNLRLNYENASNIVIEALRLGIPQGLVRLVLLLSDEGYALGRRDNIDGKNPFEDFYGKAEKDEIKYLDENRIRNFSFQSARIGIPKSLIPATLKVVESAYLIGFADQIFGLPENYLDYYLRLDILTKIAHKKEVTTQ
ncbi:hypothetical protein FJZ20_02415 [Candidatus Pacearchaeota archaeon]|nr:hypothetical protein [Candidatus Pacearchaeota archaeon]